MSSTVDCLLCKRLCFPHPRVVGLWTHPSVEDCLVELVDRWGVSAEPPEQRDEDAPVELDGDLVVDFNRFALVDAVLPEIFAEAGLARLGGQSTGRGWSYYSLFQKCPYAWARRYVDEAKPILSIESEGLAVGTILHTHLALYYTNMNIDGEPPLTPEDVHQRLLARCNPDYVQEGWRLFTAYRLFYEFENIQPLAVEYDLVDPRTGFSCRYDLIAFLPESVGDRPAGTYGFEHKSAQRFDRATLEGWSNDGEVIGQAALWKRLGLDKRFGELRGMIVNIVGKQKEPRMHRTIVSPQSWQVDQHLKDLQRWDGLINLARKFEQYPRARSSCVHRFGMCEWFEHCAGQE